MNDAVTTNRATAESRWSSKPRGQARLKAAAPRDVNPEKAAQAAKTALEKTPTLFDAIISALHLGARAALTLYYNQDCWANPANEIFTWTQAHVPDDRGSTTS